MDLSGKDRLLMVLAHRDYVYATSEMTADRIKAAFDEYLKDNPYVWGPEDHPLQRMVLSTPDSA